MSTILIVDDAAIVREPIAAALRAAGYETRCAQSGQEALALLRSWIPDLLLLDLSMPGVGGLEVLHCIRAVPATEKLPVILLTGAQQRALVIQAARLGVRDYLLKSGFSISDLLSRVAGHLTPRPG